MEVIRVYVPDVGVMSRKVICPFCQAELSYKGLSPAYCLYCKRQLLDYSNLEKLQLWRVSFHLGVDTSCYGYGST